MELRVAGIIAGLLGLTLVSHWRFHRGRLRNIDWLVASGLSLGLIGIGFFPNSLDVILGFFSFQRGSGGRLIGLLIFSNLLLYVLFYLALSRNRRMEFQLDKLVRELAKREYRERHTQSEAPIYVIIPAYNEGENIATVLAQIPEEVCGLKTRILVVVDGATDETESVVMGLRHASVTHTVNRGGGAALKAGYEVAIEDGASIVVTLDADGQHLPEQMAALVQPIVEDKADLVNGSRVLGEYEKDSHVRAAGVVLFNRLISILTMTTITDASNAFRAIRVDQLARLQLQQSQFHTSELLIEALKRGLRVQEVPITIRRRLAGETKKPPSIRYAWGFGKAIVSTWLR